MSHVLQKNPFSTRLFYFCTDFKFSYENKTKENWLKGKSGTQLLKSLSKEDMQYFPGMLRLNSLGLSTVNDDLWQSLTELWCCKSSTPLLLSCSPSYSALIFFLNKSIIPFSLISTAGWVLQSVLGSQWNFHQLSHCSWIDIVPSPGRGQDDLIGLFHFYHQWYHEYNTISSVLSIVKE